MMTNRFRHALFAAVVALVGAAQLRAQTYTCESSTSPAATSTRDRIVRLVTATDSSAAARRAAYQLPVATASAVTFVTNKTTCETAGTAYTAARNTTATSSLSRSMIVVKVGTTSYVLFDAHERFGEFEFTVITDLNFAVLALIAS
jgi:hypothetical protein